MVKISVLTPTYNRGKLLKKLYNSLVNNINSNVKIEWLIMDDGSEDDTKDIVEVLKSEKILDIKYIFQKNQGKMKALNSLIEYVTGELIVECDSDDYFEGKAFTNIVQAYEESKNDRELYALCFLKYDNNNNNMGQNFKSDKTTMFDLYFKEGEDGEKALVYFSDIRKKYKYKLEKEERFITEARLHHELDLKYKIKCYNKPIMICEYQKDGYTKNIQKIFKENPYGYFEYFKEILQRDMSGVKFSKRIYVIKHYILFSYLTNQRKLMNNINDIVNKILFGILYIPGRVKSKRF